MTIQFTDVCIMLADGEQLEVLVTALRTVFFTPVSVFLITGGAVAQPCVNSHGFLNGNLPLLMPPPPLNQRPLTDSQKVVSCFRL